MDKHFNIEEAKKAQSDYCKEHKLPHFAPSTGYCWACGNNIYLQKISVEEAGNKLITSCPACFTSYCE